MSPEPTDLAFTQIELESFDRTPCSPALPDGEEGLRIAAPKQVRVSARPIVPLCATASFAADRKGIPTQLWEQTTVVVVNGDGTELRTGIVGNSSGTPAPMPPPEPDPNPEPVDEDEFVLTNASFSECINVDLIEKAGWVARLGPIHAFITLGSWQSNTVRIEFVPGED